MNYTINKGVGKDVEFHGLRAQYLFISPAVWQVYSCYSS